MAYESRAYDNEWGDPVVVLVVTGTHDVSRLVNLFKSGMNLVEHIGVGDTMLSQVHRHNGGRAALQLLAAHGGPDFLHEAAPAETAPAMTPTELVILRGYAAGLEDREIAELCGKTYSRTTKVAKALRHRLGARNRAHAAVIALQGGLIAIEASHRLVGDQPAPIAEPAGAR